LRNLRQLLAIARDREDLRLAGVDGGKREMPPVGRERWALVSAIAVRDLPALTCGDVVNPDVEAPDALQAEYAILLKGAGDQVARSAHESLNVRRRVLRPSVSITQSWGVPVRLATDGEA
jgi:hypothetical protein